jgi:hypothetical protein
MYEVHVYDDGDVEVTVIDEKKITNDITFTTKEALIEELQIYGCEDHKIKRSLQYLLVEGDTIIIS